MKNLLAWLLLLPSLLTAQVTLSGTANVSGTTNASTFQYQTPAPTFDPVNPYTGSNVTVTISDIVGSATITYCTSSTTCTPGTTYTIGISFTASGPTHICAYANATHFSQSNTVCWIGSWTNAPHYVGPFVAQYNSSGAGATQTFTAAAVAANDAVLVSASTKCTTAPTSVTLTATGWTFTQLGSINNQSSTGVCQAVFGAIAPNTTSRTFTVTWTGGTFPASGADDLGDEFAPVNTTGGTTTFDSSSLANDGGSGGTNITTTVTPGNDFEALWGALWLQQTPTVGSGFTQGATDSVGNFTEYKILGSGTGGNSQTVNFTGNTSGWWVIGAVSVLGQ